MTKTFLQILPTEKMPEALTYSIPSGGLPNGMAQPQPGTYVTIPFRNKETRGVVWSGEPAAGLNASKIKDLVAVHDKHPPMQPELQKFIQWVADYTMAPMGGILRTALPAGVLNIPNKPPKPPATLNPDAMQVVLSEEQTAALTTVRQSEKPILIDGVTGSGKTEVYLERIADVLRDGGQALVLLPEIALSVQMLERFTKRFGAAPVLWHSGLTPAQRRNTWQAVTKGQAQLVLGARSGLFLPFKDLQLIIIDEEHDGTYKQEESVLYHARDMAVVRGALAKAQVILLSATPSLETLHNVEHGKYTVAKLTKRHHAMPLPTMGAIDLRQFPPTPGEPRRWISPPLLDKVNETLAKGEQALLFLNRRGYAPLSVCGDCGFKWECPSCSVWLVRHGNHLRCHHCGYGGKAPNTCPSCGAKDSAVACGPGIDRLAEEVSIVLPSANAITLSSDTLGSRKAAADALEDIHSGRKNLLIGTQVIAKGHHFPKLTLVGIIDADLGLSGGDPRAAEKNWQLLHQVAGRAGREKEPGRVFLQTHQPDNPLLQTLLNHDRDGFLEQQKQERRLYRLPPYYRLVGIVVSGRDEQATQQAAVKLARCAPVHQDIEILGPSPAPIYRLRGNFRQRLLVRSPKKLKIQQFLTQWLCKFGKNSGINVLIDIDPYSFY